MTSSNILGQQSAMTDPKGFMSSSLMFNFEGHTSSRYGGIAQLGEHLLCKQGVSGSIPLISTIGRLTRSSTLTSGQIWAYSSAG